MTKRKIVLIYAPLLIALAACGGKNIPSSSTSEVNPNPYADSEEPISFSDEVYSVNFKGYVTGKDAPSDTLQYAVGGCDLGYPVYDPDDGATYMFFGDSFDSPSQTGRWRSNVIGVTYETAETLDDGLEFDHFVAGPSGIAKPAIEGHHADMMEMTKIPTGVFKLNDTFYMFYFSKYSWNVSALHSMNYCGCIKSTNKCKTWERVYDLTWVDHATLEGLDASQTGDPAIIQQLINEDVDGLPDGGDVDIVHHEAYRFTEITPRLGDDGYVYIYGQGGYRSSYISLARVKAENFEIFDEYEYLIGYDEDNNPQWLKGREGLDYLDSHPEEGYCLEVTASEMTIAWSKKFKQYVICFSSSRNTSSKGGATLFFSKNIYGPFKPKGILTLASSNPFYDNFSLYAPMISDQWQSEDGNEIYVVSSMWKPQYNPILTKTTFN